MLNCAYPLDVCHCVFICVLCTTTRQYRAATPERTMHELGSRMSTQAYCTHGPLQEVAYSTSVRTACGEPGKRTTVISWASRMSTLSSGVYGKIAPCEYEQGPGHMPAPEKEQPCW